MEEKTSRKLDPGEEAENPRPAKQAKTTAELAAVAGGEQKVNFIQVDGKTCTHEVSWPPGATEGSSTAPPGPRAGDPAKNYPFKLDPFQNIAINCLEAGHSVLVAAHTSAGKTVVAEYAFAMALRDNQRVIYTSPLKALSNQKYRELEQEFTDVGLMTGDVTINPTASCLVMTTEILRSMLYRGSTIIREAALVVYDEIHYLRDKERGVVWEESIILMPKSVRFAFLSATLPNAREFADWISSTHGSPCHVVYTDYRPTPLQHYIFPVGGDGLYMVMDERNTFREENFQKAVAVLNDSSAEGGGGPSGKGKKQNGKAGGKDGKKKEEKSDIYKIVKMIMDRKFDPVIVFSFSKRDCEALAMQMAALDLNSDAEKALVDQVFSSAMDCLGEADRALPQIGAMLPMLKRGIGIHHSGLLPILKEVIEIMFQEGLLKALFATETFSTGLNMPAKTVVFTSARKFDGQGYRWVSSGEYIQMSGRAGRRGLDERGIVVLMLDTKMEPAVAREMVKGAPDVLRSEFHLGYNMLLNLLRAEGVGDVEGLVRSSFRQFQLERDRPNMEAKRQQLEAERDAMVIEAEEQVAEYLDLMRQAAAMRRELRGHVSAPRAALPFLQTGRLVRLLSLAEPDAPETIVEPEASSSGGGAGDGDRADSNGAAAPLGFEDGGAWGVIVNFERKGKKGEDKGDKDKRPGKSKAAGWILDVLINVTADTAPGSGPKRIPKFLPAGAAGGVASIVTVSMVQLDRLSSIRVYLPKDLRPASARDLTLKSLAEVHRRYPAGLPLLDPEEDMGLDDPAFLKAQSKAETLEALLAEHPLAGAPELRQRLEALQRKQAVEETIRVAKKDARAASAMILKEEVRARRRVLRKLGYVDGEGVVSVKGRVAAELQTADELVLTELIFAGVFKEMGPAHIAALLSCFVWREKSEGKSRLKAEMEGPLSALQEAARRVAKVEEDCKMTVDVDEYVSSFRPDLMEAVALWARGATFAQVLEAADTFEGSLVRAVRRLEEVMRQVVAASKVMGELDLTVRFEEAITAIKRDIIFAASLYL